MSTGGETGVIGRIAIVKERSRPNVRYYIKEIFSDFIELHGDRAFGDDRAICGGIGFLGDRPVTVIGNVKGANVSDSIDANFGMAHPEGYRKAMRLMKQAEKFGRAVVCLVDTPGAYCGVGAEERGIGQAIAANLRDMMELGVPVVTVITGEGGSGGALGLAVANRVLMLGNATYSVISPKGFASILWKDPARESEAAEIMRITAEDLLSFGIIDGIVPEPAAGAHTDPKAAASALRQALTRELDGFDGLTYAQISAGRYDRFRKIGRFMEAPEDEESE